MWHDSGKPPTPLGLHIHKKDLHWAPKSINMTYIGLFGALEPSHGGHNGDGMRSFNLPFLCIIV